VRVLVTGGNRFVGLQLVRRLHALGHDVTVINSHPVPYPEGVRRVHAVRGDREPFAAALSGIEVDAVFDNTAYGPADVKPVLAAFAGRVQQYLFTSSIAAYRVSDLQPIHEHFPTETDPARNVRGSLISWPAAIGNLLVHCAYSRSRVKRIRRRGVIFQAEKRNHENTSNFAGAGCTGHGRRAQSGGG